MSQWLSRGSQLGDIATPFWRFRVCEAEGGILKFSNNEVEFAAEVTLPFTGR